MLENCILIASFFNMTPKAYLGSYLGVFFNSYYPTKSDYSHILIQSNLEYDFLSKAGRHTLIQFNLESLPAYTCSS